MAWAPIEIFCFCLPASPTFPIKSQLLGKFVLPSVMPRWGLTALEEEGPGQQQIRMAVAKHSVGYFTLCTAK